MQFKTFEEVFQEGAKYHEKATNDQSLLKAERGKLYAMAEFCYNHVLEEDPDCVPALQNLGTLYTENGRWGVGLALLKRALALNPTFDAYNALGATLRRVNKPEKAREFLSKAVEMDPKNSYALHNMAGTFINEGDPEAALRWARRAVEADPINPNHKLTLGLAQLELGDYENAWPNMEVGRSDTTWNGRDYGPEVKRWTGEPGQNVVVFGEQGVGDEILFASCLPDLIKISKSVVIDCHPRLIDLMKRSFPDCAVYGTRKDEFIHWNPKDHALNAKVPFGSLPAFFRKSKDAFPKQTANYIKPDPDLVRHYKKPGLRVGLSWVGGTKQTHVMYRSLPPEQLGPLLTIPGIEWVSLQYTDKAFEEAERMKALYGCKIEHDKEINEGVEGGPVDRHGNSKGDLNKLFATIAGLDLVVTVLNSNIHFAGSMGIPVWCLTPVRASWPFMLPQVDWYTQHRVFRQPKDGDWDSVLWSIAGELRALTMARDAAE